MTNIDRRFTSEIANIAIDFARESSVAAERLVCVAASVPETVFGQAVLSSSLVDTVEPSRARVRASTKQFSGRFSGEEQYPYYVNSDDGYYTVPTSILISLLKNREFMPLPYSKVLDFGAGTGRNGLLLAALGYQVVLLEPSPAGCDFMREQSEELGVEQYCSITQDVEQALNDGPFDIVLMITVLEQLPSDTRADTTHKVVDRMRPGALLVATGQLVTDPSATGVNRGSESSKLVTDYLEPGELRAIFGPRMTERHYLERHKLDLSHGSPHYHDMVEYIGSKKP